MRAARPILTALPFVFFMACGGGASESPRPETPTNPPAAGSEPGSPGDVVSSPPGSVGHTPGPGTGDVPMCRLPAPVVSEDACKTNADCAPSDPCHARACVAKAKAKPGGPRTVCTEMADCQSVDVNPCSCYQGRCALVPPAQ